MNKILDFWIASSIVLFLLSFVYVHQSLYRKNALFALWLSLGIIMQIVSAYGMLLAYPAWMYNLWPIADKLSYALAAGVLAFAFIRRSCPVNQILLYGLGAMVAFSLAVRALGGGLSLDFRSWLLNIAFLGPAVFLLLAFSNITVDRLPLYIDMVLRAFATDSQASHELAFGSMSKRTTPHVA